jgi:murein DD-endopeptidase MepM/ murein hydrolase activator NlpD
MGFTSTTSDLPRQTWNGFLSSRLTGPIGIFAVSFVQHLKANPILTPYGSLKGRSEAFGRQIIPHNPKFSVQMLRPSRPLTSLALGIASGIATLTATAAVALQVQVTPSNPRLGDTLSVVIQTEGDTPTVSMQQQTYPTFAVGSNQFRALLPTTPLDQPGTWQIRVTGDGQEKNLAVQVGRRTFPTQRIRIRSSASGGMEPTQHELDRVRAFRQIVTPEKFWRGPFLAPNRGRVSTVYGVRRYYNGVFAKDYFHRGVDYAGGQGSPVFAPAAGRIALVGRLSDGFRLHGNTIGIDHGQGVTSVFLHLSRIDVREGDFVQPGQVIGAVGSTGASTGPHLHWGLYVHGKSVDPIPWRTQGIE